MGFIVGNAVPMGKVFTRQVSRFPICDKNMLFVRYCSIFVHRKIKCLMAGSTMMSESPVTTQALSVFKSSQRSDHR
jgi:hypothetical protein